MCGRFALATRPGALAEQFSIAEPAQFAARYNIAPSQPVLVVRSDGHRRSGDFLEWGLVPSWSKDPRASRRPINARAETVNEKPSFRAAYRHRRCLVPADGYYEWATRAHGKQAYYIHRDDGSCFALAGLWEFWERDGYVIESCALLTCAANERLSAFHQRMPVIIEPQNYALWLAQNAALSDLNNLLAPAASATLTLHAVSKRVNSPSNDSIECIEPDVEAPA